MSEAAKLLRFPAIGEQTAQHHSGLLNEKNLYVDKGADRVPRLLKPMSTWALRTRMSRYIRFQGQSGSPRTSFKRGFMTRNDSSRSGEMYLDRWL